MEDKKDIKDVATRAIKTFVEASVSLAIAQVSGIQLGEGLTKQFFLNIGIAALSAGLSAAWNGVIQPWLKGAEK